MKISILGCSYSDYYYQSDEHSYTYFLANEYPDAEITSFAMSASCVDYLFFVLNWMVDTKWKTDLIIMNYPPLYRIMHWVGEGYVIESRKDRLFTFNETEQDNVKVAELHESMSHLKIGTKVYNTANQAKSDILGITDQIDDFYVRTLSNARSVFVWNNYCKHKLLPHYETLLDTKIFYFSQAMPPGAYQPTNNISNFKEETAIDFMSANTKNYLLDLSHFNTYGNEYLYENYLKQGELGDFLKRINDGK